jgi:transglutaminase-like putative cysteine protease
MHIWVSLFCVLIAGWGYQIATRKWRYPVMLIRVAVVIVSCTAVAYSYGTLVGRDAGVALLVIMLSLKLLEIKTHRDVVLFVFIGYFLVVTNFLFSQSMAMAVYMLMVSTGLTSTLVMLSRHDEGLHAFSNIRVAGTLILQAMPLMLIMFLLFPRLPGPLWLMPEDKNRAISGLSNSMSPGEISNLIRSDAVAFRVKFNDQAPAASQLYWRGPVLTLFDGRTWHSKPALLRNTSERIEHTGAKTNYTITLEPHYKRWLFALDMPIDIPPGSLIDPNYSLLASKDITNLSQYSIGSYTSYRIGEQLRQWHRQSNLRLPVTLNPRTREWADSVAQKFPSKRERIQHILTHFRQQPFSYTLNPPLLGRDSIDDFLFNSRSGFCEHYAGSFVYLMRLLDIPARVVLGYQGGEYNELGDYMIVRQSDAHAWAEVWLSNEGWVRIDPTSAVAPERVETGIDAALPERASSGGLIRSVNPIFRNLVLYWDSLNYRWHRWVLGYDAGLQRSFLQRLGIDAGNWQDIAIAIIVAMGSLVLIISVWMNLRNRERQKDSIARLYQQYCQRLARIGFQREAYEGPRDFAARVTQQRHDLSQDIELITRFYLQLRYGRNPPEQLFSQFKKRIRHFKPRISKRPISP